MDSIYGDHNKDYGNQGFYLARFGRDTGIEKGICGSLRKSNIWVQGRWSLDAIEIDLRIFTGCILDRDSFISFSYLMEMGLFYLTEAWVHWYLWGSRSESIKLQRYGLIVEYLVFEYMGIWGQYKGMTEVFFWGYHWFIPHSFHA